MSKEKYYTSVEAAQELGVSQPTISRWLNEGFLVGARKKGPYKNSPWTIPQSAIDAFKEQMDSVSPKQEE